MSHQLPLELISPQTYRPEDLIVTAANEALYDLLKAPKWLHPHLWLASSEGSGKTHLGHVFKDLSSASFLSSAETHGLIGADFPDADVVIDDADTANEEVLFHLINRSLASQKRLLLLSRKHPVDVQPALPDLSSRLKAMRVIDMPEPDEAMLRALLVRLFARRAISPSAEFIEFLSRRMERSIPAAQKIVTDIDHYANGRPFNRTLARDFLDQAENLSWLNDGDGF